MSAIAQIKLSSLLDFIGKTTDAATGVDKTFDPEGFNSGVARWVDRSLSTLNPTGVAIGYPVITLNVRPPNQGSRMYKVTMKVVQPILEQTSPSTATGIQPAPTKAFDLTCVQEWMLPERSTQAQRDNFFSYVASAMLVTITASDGIPTDSTGSPLKAAISTYERPY